jgi:hypothetical protein
VVAVHQVAVGGRLAVHQRHQTGRRRPRNDGVGQALPSSGLAVAGAAETQDVGHDPERHPLEERVGDEVAAGQLGGQLVEGEGRQPSQTGGVKQERVALEVALGGDALVGRHGLAVGPRDRGAALHPGDQLVGVDHHDCRRRLQRSVGAERGEQDALGVAGGLDGLGQAIDVVLGGRTGGDPHAQPPGPPQRPGLEDELVVGGGAVHLDAAAAGLGQQDLHELAARVAVQRGEGLRRKAPLRLGRTALGGHQLISVVRPSSRPVRRRSST